METLIIIVAVTYIFITAAELLSSAHVQLFNVVGFYIHGSKY